MIPILIGIIAYFTHYNKNGAMWLVNGIIAEISMSIACINCFCFC
nr:hypothetical protein [Candidatus Sigynarchaeum springense]